MGHTWDIKADSSSETIEQGELDIMTLITFCYGVMTNVIKADLCALRQN